MTPTFTIERDREADGQWIAEVVEIPGVLSYGASEDEAVLRAEALAFRVLAERIEHGEMGRVSGVRFVAA